MIDRESIEKMKSFITKIGICILLILLFLVNEIRGVKINEKTGSYDLDICFYSKWY